jgi:mevalonate kinase
VKTATLSIAGKTFLAGEYLALRGGPAVVLATEPRFQLKVLEKKSTQNPFHPKSPAGLFYLEHHDFFSCFQLDFQDPYQSLGGFGASSAQFALLHALKQLNQTVFEESERFIDWHEILKDYRKISVDQENPPSGADIVGAVSGAVTWFDRSHGKVQTFAWPFQEYDFGLYHTGVKLSTHEHLASLGEFSSDKMGQALGGVHQGLKEVSFDLLLAGLRDFQDILLEQKLVAAHTGKILSELKKNSDILFAKGCGALGSDVIFALMKQGISAPDEIVRLKRIAGAKDLSPGLKVHA